MAPITAPPAEPRIVDRLPPRGFDRAALFWAAHLAFWGAAFAGNVFEWNDLDGTVGSSRGRRGGDWFNGAVLLSSAQRVTEDPSFEISNVGFRLAAVPEPASLGLAATGGLAALGWTMLRRHRR